MTEPSHRYTAAFAGTIETTWQARWEEAGVFSQPNPGEDGWDGTRPKFYCLDMFPYPSGAGLHVGHPEGYTATDIVCRYKKMNGYNVLHPMGWDAFGLPAEQYAIQTGVHPAETTRKAIDNFRRQLKRFGFCYDWSREFGTIDEDYYKWTQWIFLKIYHAWYDPEIARARPIEELVEELETGERPAIFNPDAAEYGAAGAPGREEFPWSQLDEETRRAIVDSYRLAYVAEQTVNWCPKLGTALANEEVIDGRSERGGFPVFRKPLRQWQFRITAYAERLLDDLKNLDWPSSTRTQQAEWIGRSEGAHVDFFLKDGPSAHEGLPLRVFTTRPDTLFGATFMVVAPEHPLVGAVLEEPCPGCDRRQIRAYVDHAKNLSDVERQENKEKTGVPLGVQAINPATGKPIPVWTADYVLMGYGTGAIMAVPGQDERDWEFAEKFGLPIIRTVQPPEGWDGKAYTGGGPAMNSGFLDGMGIVEAKSAMTDWLEQEGKGRRKVNYKLRDWLFSRQRYWGEPFPVVYDERGFHFGVDESALPVRLPPMKDYEPEESDEPQPLLAKAHDWVRTTAGEAGVSALPADAPVRRETNTMPGWAGSCWYFLRYCDPKNGERFVGREAERAWMLTPKPGVSRAQLDEFGDFPVEYAGVGGVDLYVGGSEHAVLHLLYARFWHKVLFDLGEVSTPEPFQKLFHQGLILSHAYQRADRSLVPMDQVENRGTEDNPEYVETATGGRVTQIVAKMSKSLKNVVNPDDVIADYGADTFRLYEMYMGPLEASKPWDTRAIEGMFRFLRDVWRLCIDEGTGEPRIAPEADDAIEKLLHRTIAKVGQDIEKLAFNTAIAAMIEFKNAATPKGGLESGGASLTADQMGRLVRILAPFAPHLAEEVWSRLGRFEAEGTIATAAWPTFDEAMLVDDEIEVPVQILGKVRGKVTVPADADEKAMEEAALGDERIKALLEGKTVRKVIVVPGRLVNIVAN
ncbi:MAG: leucine--tRNA ligase [Phycisphaeraceae bacterium]|nr:MAG: leucine--tRNA ligase [Phycisphaeraceae bacterium]